MKNKLELIFIDLNNNQNKFLCSRSGSDFEERIIDCFKKHGVDRRVKEHDADLKKYVASIRPLITDKLSTSLLVNTIGADNPYYRGIFIHQPYGSQEYPDILYFGKYIVPIEIKFTKDKSHVPMWNGNLPKDSGIYIFGQYGEKQLTFFMGKDVLSHEDRLFLTNKSNAMRAICPDKITENGFIVYFRETYAQRTSFNYFDEKRVSREQSVIEFVKKLED